VEEEEELNQTFAIAIGKRGTAGGGDDDDDDDDDDT